MTDNHSATHQDTIILSADIRIVGETGTQLHILLGTRSSTDLEAATMYKLKGQSSNMRTDQSLRYRELFRSAGLSSRPV